MVVVATAVGLTRGDDPLLALPVLAMLLVVGWSLLGYFAVRFMRLRRMLGSQRRALEDLRRRSPEAARLVRELEKLA